MSEILTPQDLEAMLKHFAQKAYEACCYRDCIASDQFDARRETDFQVQSLYRGLRENGVSDERLQKLFKEAQSKAEKRYEDTPDA